MNCALREHQGRPRGASRRRLRVHERRPGDGRSGRLAAHRLPDARRTAVLRRHVLSARATARACAGFRPYSRPRQPPTARSGTRSAAMGEKVREAVAPRQLPAAAEPTAALLDAAARKLASDSRSSPRRFRRRAEVPPPAGARPDAAPVAGATGDAVMRDAAVLTLDAMSRGGIHDQVGGGFHRYSVDARWSVPHFEKMLYDNALLAPVYLHAYQFSGREDMLEVCTRTLDYMARELRLPGGAFAASQDADSPGGEGAFFVWTPCAAAGHARRRRRRSRCARVRRRRRRQLRARQRRCSPCPIRSRRWPGRCRSMKPALHARVEEIRTGSWVARAVASRTGA